MMTTEYFGPAVTALVWRDEEGLLVGCSRGTIYLLDVKQNKAGSTKRRLVFELGSNPANLALNLNKSLLASSSNTNVAVWRLDPLSNLNTLRGHKAKVEEVKFSPIFFPLLATWDQKWQIRLWDALAGTCQKVIQCTQGGMKTNHVENFMSFSPDGQLLACRGEEVSVFRVATGKLDTVYMVEGKMVRWNGDSNKLAVVTKDYGKKGEIDKVVIFNT